MVCDTVSVSETMAAAGGEGVGERLTGTTWGQGIHGAVPVDLGAPERMEPVGPVRSFLTMQEGIPQGGTGGIEGLPKWERSQRWRLLEQGLR